jgi:S-methylmethionine-dependent homocysteine/selenocysteine methylase
MENYKYIQDKLNDDKIVILDGATSSELEKNGVKMDEIGWAAPSSITNPAVLQNVHNNYINAGADIITTNTFSSARHVLENSLTYKDKVNEINIKAVECAILAKNKYPDKKICVAGSLSLSYVADIVKGKRHDLKFRRDHYGSYGPDVIFKNFEEQVSIFKKYNIDLILLEMVIDPFICKPAIEVALASELPVWLGLSCGNQSSKGDLLAFESDEMKFAESLKMINDSFDAVLLMHSEVKNITKGIEEIKQNWDGPLGTYPHTGKFIRPNWHHDTTYTPKHYLNDMKNWVNQGVRIIGSCCGMGPEYISILRKNFN